MTAAGTRALPRSDGNPGDNVAYPTGGAPATDPEMPPVPEPVNKWKDLVQK